MLREPMNPARAKQLIRQILETGTVTYSTHARDELAEDDLTIQDAENVLRGGRVEAPRKERGSWRYRVRTARICVVIAFRSEHELVIVTAWRFKR